jgi:hypothetical protein
MHPIQLNQWLPAEVMLDPHARAVPKGGAEMKYEILN